MKLYSPANSPEQNLALLAGNSYPGRLLVVGFPDVGGAVLAYALEGRSVGSRNRRLVVADNTVSTEVVDRSLSFGDPDLTIYDAMRRVGEVEIVSNGNQTDRVVRYLRCGGNFEDAMKATHHEPDAPNFTPRITGFHDLSASGDEPRFGLSVIRKDPEGDGSIRELYTDRSPEIALGRRGVGYCVHTYQGDGDPLRSFAEAPFVVPVKDTAGEMADMLWKSLDSDNRVAVAAKTIGPDGVVEFAVINQHA